MRVLVAHNRYQSASPSGENAVVDAEIALLRENGIEVLEHVEDSDDLLNASMRKLATAAIGPLYAPKSVARFKRLLNIHRPDVVHLHNPYPLISPAVVRTASAHEIPVVQTIHNYRHSCVNGLHLRDGRPCTDCLGRVIPHPAVRHGCYRGSRAQSTPMALGQLLHRPTWQLVSRYLALTPFMARHLEASGIQPERIVIRPSWVPDTGAAPDIGRDFLFVGRLDQSKGVQLLLEAWQSRRSPDGAKLRFVGDGPLAELVERVSQLDPTIEYCGRLGREATDTALSQAACLVIPSIWFEGYPLVIAEAFAKGRPVVVLDGGSPATIVDAQVGWISPPTPSGLAETLSRVSSSEARDRGAAARSRYEKENSPQAALTSLLATYSAVLNDTR